jgi:hypothetical protein
VVEVKERNIHLLCSCPKIKVVETAHLAALVFAAFAKKLFLGKFERPTVE